MKAMTTGIPETTRKRFKKKVNLLRWRKAVMPCYYNCPHEYIVRERDLFYEGASWGCSGKGFSILQENDQDARRAKEMAASARRRAVRWSLRLLAD